MNVTAKEKEKIGKKILGRCGEFGKMLSVVMGALGKAPRRLESNLKCIVWTPQWNSSKRNTLLGMLRKLSELQGMQV